MQHIRSVILVSLLSASAFASQPAKTQTFVFDRMFHHHGPYPYKDLMTNGSDEYRGRIACAPGKDWKKVGYEAHVLTLYVTMLKTHEYLTFSKNYPSFAKCKPVENEIRDSLDQVGGIKVTTQGSKIIDLVY